MKTINFEGTILRQEITTRGGGIEIDLTHFGYVNEKMTAHQNYLGGGMLGRVTNDSTIPMWENNSKLDNIAEQLRMYFFNITNPDTEWEHQTYEQNQKMDISAF